MSYLGSFSTGVATALGEDYCFGGGTDAVSIIGFLINTKSPPVLPSELTDRCSRSTSGWQIETMGQLRPRHANEHGTERDQKWEQRIA